MQSLIATQGDRLSATRWNDLVRAVMSSGSPGPLTLMVPGVGYVRRRPPTRAGGGGAAIATFAAITSRAGTSPPYRYTAAEQVVSAAGVWTPKSGGASYNNVWNVEEQGIGGQWVNPLLTGDVVLLFGAPGDSGPLPDAFVCIRAHYRGTY